MFGRQAQRRVCVSATRGCPCIGDSLRTVPCGQAAVCSNSKYSSLKCAEGFRQSGQTCTRITPPQADPLPVADPYQNDPSCKMVASCPCPLDGAWSDWKPVSPCPAIPNFYSDGPGNLTMDTCGSCQVHLQQRTCLSLPRGCPCKGLTYRWARCNPLLCSFPIQTCCDDVDGIKKQLNITAKKYECLPTPKDLWNLASTSIDIYSDNNCPSQTTKKPENCACSTNGYWSAWTSFGACMPSWAWHQVGSPSDDNMRRTQLKFTCGMYGRQIQRRVCVSAKRGCPCRGDSIREIPCGQAAPCAINQLQNFTCANQFRLSGSNCVPIGIPLADPPVVADPFQNDPTCKISPSCPCQDDGVWSAWTSVSDCPMMPNIYSSSHVMRPPCGSCQVQLQQRTCLSLPRGCPCKGLTYRWKRCNTLICEFPIQTCCDDVDGIKKQLNITSKKFECLPTPMNLWDDGPATTDIYGENKCTTTKATTTTKTTTRAAPTTTTPYCEPVNSCDEIPGFTEIDGACYKIIEVNADYWTAWEQCQLQSNHCATLGVIRCQDQNDKIYQLLRANQAIMDKLGAYEDAYFYGTDDESLTPLPDGMFNLQMWIGYYNVHTNITTTNNETIVFENWAPGEPNDGEGGEPCVQMYITEWGVAGQTPMWNDYKCSAPMIAALCEVPTVTSLGGCALVTTPTTPKPPTTTTPYCEPVTSCDEIPGFTEINGACYKIIGVNGDHQAAWDQCQLQTDHCATLGVIRCQEQNDRIYELLRSNPELMARLQKAREDSYDYYYYFQPSLFKMWIGYPNVNTNFNSTNNGTIVFQNWAPGEPSNGSEEQCAQMYITDWAVADGDLTKWSDVPCDSRTLAALCEVPTIQSLSGCSLTSTTTTTAPTTTPYCPPVSSCDEVPGFTDINGACYKVIMVLGDYNTARELCQQQADHCGTTLGVIHCEDQNYKIHDLIRANGPLMAQMDLRGYNYYEDYQFTGIDDYQTWIGIYNVHTNISAANNETISYQNWSPGEPNDEGGEECVQMYITEFSFRVREFLKWNDRPCDSNMLAALCEVPSVNFEAGCKNPSTPAACTLCSYDQLRLGDGKDFASVTQGQDANGCLTQTVVCLPQPGNDFAAIRYDVMNREQDPTNITRTLICDKNRVWTVAEGIYGSLPVFHTMGCY